MRSTILAFLQLLLVPTSALPDPMEVQRCIWACLANSKGADDPAYQQCIDARCNDIGAAEEMSAPAGDGWTYGEHPVLGLYAHIRVGDGALGFACIPPAPMSGYSTSIRATDGLIPNADKMAGPVVVFTGPFQLGGSFSLTDQREGFRETRHDACLSGIDSFRRPAAAHFLDVEEMGLTWTGTGNVMSVKKGEGSYEISGAEDLSRLDGTLVVPLGGSARAIARLIRACPAIGEQLAQGCDSGD